MTKLIPLVLGVLLLASQCTAAEAAGPFANTTTFVYFTGIGCPHCAKTDPVLFKQKVRHNDLLIIEYEIYRESVNAPLLLDYYFFFEDRPGIPAIIAGSRPGQTISGDWPILADVDRLIRTRKGNGVTFPAKSIPFAKVRLTDVPARPKLWYRNRVAVRKNLASKESYAVKLFLWTGQPPKGCRPIAERTVALSGGAVYFRESCAFNGWHLMRD